MENPSRASDDGPAFDEFPRDGRSARGHDTLEREARSGMQTEGFFDASVEERELLAFSPGHEAMITIRKSALGSAIVELGVEFAQGGGVLEEVVEDGGEGDGGCFGAGEGHADGHGGDEGVGHEFWSVDLRLHEF